MKDENNPLNGYSENSHARFLNNKEIFMNIFGKSTIPTLFYDKNYRLVFANQSTLRMFRVKDLSNISDVNLFDFPWINRDHRNKLEKEDSVEFQSVIDLGLVKKAEFVKSEGERIIHTIWTITSLEDSGYLVQIQDITDQKKAEKALHDSEKRYHELFNNPLNAFVLHEVVTDKNGNPSDFILLEANDAFEKLTGLKTEEIINKKISEYVPDIKDTDLMDTYINVALTGRPAHFEQFFSQMNRYFDIAAFLPRKGQLTVFFADITRRKSAERKLQDTLRHLEIEKRQLSAIIENAPVGVIIAEAPSGKFLLANKQIAEIWHYPSEAKADEFKKYKGFHSDGKSYKPHEWPLSRSVRTGEMVKDEEIEILRGDGTRGWLSVSSVPVRDDEGNIIMGIVIDLDTTEHKKVEDALKESETKYRTIFESTKTAFMIIEDDMTISLINGEVEKIFGYSREEIEGKKKWTDFVAKKDDLEMMTEYHQLRRINPEAAPKEYEVQAIDKEGTIKDVLISISVIPGTKRSIASFLDITSRKKSEEALRKSKGRLESIIQGSPVLTFIIDKNHRVLHWNKAIEEYSGVKAKEVVGTEDHWKALYSEKRPTMADLIIEEDFERVSELYPGKYKRSKIVEGAYEIEDFFPIMGEKGRWLRATVSAIKDSEDNIIGAMEILEDITERKQAEEKLKEARDNLEEQVKERTAELEKAYGALAESEEKFREIFNNANDMISVSELQENRMPGQFIEVNEVASKMLGYSKEELLNMTPFDIVHPDSPVSVSEIGSEMLKKGYARHESIFVAKDGFKIPVEVATHFFKLRGKDVILAVSRDITERKKAEEALKESEKKFRELFNKALDIITLSESQENRLPGQFMEVNEAAIKILGYSKEEFLNMTSIDLFAPESQAEIPQITLELQEKGYTTFEAVSITKDGRKFPVEVNVHIFKLGGKEVALALTRDITDRKKAEEALKESEKKFRELFNQATDMLSLTELSDDGTIIGYIEVNEAAVKRLGYSKDELLNMTPLDIYLDNSSILKMVPELFEKGYSIAENIQVTKDGKQIPVELNTRLFKLRGKNVVISISRDITERKRAEEELRRSETILEEASSLSKMGAYEWDMEKDEFILSKEWQRIHGVKSNRLSSKDLMKISHPDDIVKVQKALDEALKGIKPYDVEHRIINQSSGEIRYIHARGRILRDKDGKPIKMYGMVRDKEGKPTKMYGVAEDITERKQAEEEIKRLVDIINSSDDAIIGEDLNGIIFSWNRGAEKMYGYSASEIVGKHMSVLMTPSKWEKISKFREEIKKGKNVAHYEAQRIRKDGTSVDISVTLSPVKNVDGEIIGVSVIARDITERRKAEKALKESEEKLNATIESSPDSITVTDLNLNVISCNQATVTMYGASSKDEIIGVNAFELVDPKDRPVLAETMKRILLENKSVTLELNLFTRKYDKFFPAEISGNVIKDADGDPVSFVTITKDITKRKKYEKERETFIKELKRSNEELQQFAYVASHDLQEPLRTIASFTQLLAYRYKGKLDKDADDFIGYVVDGTKRMQGMIKDLLQYSRVETRGGEFKQTDVEDSLNQALSNLKVAIGENSAEITHDSLPTVIADEKQLIQLFQNLISNAIKFRKEEKPPKIHISARKDEEKNEYVFSVADNGIGMKKEYMERIFELFQRLHTREEYKGTGIGLAVAKKIVDRHRGRIWVESEVGKGSTFYFTIPIGKSEENAI